MLLIQPLAATHDKNVLFVYFSSEQLFPFADWISFMA